MISKVNVTMCLSADFQVYFLFCYEFSVWGTPPPTVYSISRKLTGIGLKPNKIVTKTDSLSGN